MGVQGEIPLRGSADGGRRPFARHVAARSRAARAYDPYLPSGPPSETPVDDNGCRHCLVARDVNSSTRSGRDPADAPASFARSVPKRDVPAAGLWLIPAASSRFGPACTAPLAAAVISVVTCRAGRWLLYSVPSRHRVYAVCVPPTCYFIDCPVCCSSRRKGPANGRAVGRLPSTRPTGRASELLLWPEFSNRHRRRPPTRPAPLRRRFCPTRRLLLILFCYPVRQDPPLGAGRDAPAVRPVPRARQREGRPSGGERRLPGPASVDIAVLDPGVRCSGIFGWGGGGGGGGGGGCGGGRRRAGEQRR